MTDAAELIIARPSTVGLKLVEPTVIKPILEASLDEIQEYWQLLGMHDLLKYRLCDVENPTWSDAKELIRKIGKYMYVVYSDKILGEFTLEAQVGRAVQLHFSVRPGLTRQDKLNTVRGAAREILCCWRASKEDVVPLADTLFGLIPVQNKLAIKFVQAVGYKKAGVLPNSVCYKGKCTDGILVTLVREDL